jgi:hypothetical protein
MLFTLTLILSVTVAFTWSVYSDRRASGAVSPASSIAFIAVVVVFISAMLMWQGTLISTRDAFAVEIVDDPARAMRHLNDATLELRMRKTDVLLPAIASFFCSGSPRLTRLAATSFRVFWQPSAADMNVQFVKGAKATPWTIDDVACSDRVSKLPFDALAYPQVDAVVRDAANPADCQVYIDDGVYVLNKTALSLWTEVIGGSVLRMRRGDVGTQTLMLLRPCLLRIGGSMTRLFTVKYDAPGYDGLEYDSADKSNDFATLRIRDASKWDDMGSFEPPAAGVANVVCYYMTYQKPRAALQGDPTSLVYTATTAVAGGYTPNSEGMSEPHVATVRQAGRDAVVLELSAYRDTATVTAGGKTFRMPAGDRATIATYTSDCVIAAAVFRDRVVVRRFLPLATECAYFPIRDSPTTGTGGNVINDIISFGNMRSTSIPNLADFATRVRGGLESGMAESARSEATSLASNASSIARLLLSTPDAPLPTSNTLLPYPDQCLPVGSHITSANGKFVVAYNHDGSLGVQAKTRDACAECPATAKTDAFAYTWSSQTAKVVSRAALSPGMARIDGASGVITLQDSRGKTYWRSSLTPLPAVARPYRMVVSDSGAIEVWGKFGGGAYWTRSENNGNSGYASFDTCELASDAYASANAAAIEASTLGGRVTVTPWQHYRYRGGRDIGLHWPGAYCEE